MLGKIELRGDTRGLANVVLPLCQFVLHEVRGNRLL